MEMVQFHPTGLLAGPGTRMTGTVLEEGLRGSGGYLLDETGARFMFDYDKRGERATRDIVCRGVADRIRKGHAVAERRRLHLDGPSRRRTTCGASSRAWSSAAPTAASISPAARSR